MAEVEEIYEEEQDVEEELEIEDAAIDEVDEGEPEAEEAESEEPDEIVVSIDGEEPPPQEEQAAPEWVRELRREHRELKKRNRELESRVNQSTETNPVVSLGPKPNLEALDYDTEKYEQSLADWYERKRLVDDQQGQARRAEEEQQQAWNAKAGGLR